MTRAQAEQMLVVRCGPIMSAADMATTDTGSNADLNDPIGYGVRKAGGAVASYALVTDADVATATNLDLMLDWAEYRLLENLLTNLDDVDIEAGPRSEKLSQLAAQVERRVIRLMDKLALESANVGVFSLNFAEHGG